jgi:hypothetical protein
MLLWRPGWLTSNGYQIHGNYRFVVAARFAVGQAQRRAAVAAQPRAQAAREQVSVSSV